MIKTLESEKPGHRLNIVMVLSTAEKLLRSPDKSVERAKSSSIAL